MAISTRESILELEEKLKQAELGPDPSFFQQYLDDNMTLLWNGEVCRPKNHIVEAHKPEKGNKFTKVEMTDMEVVDHGDSAVVTCKGRYEGANGVHEIKFMRVWSRKPEGWRIIAGINY